MKINIQKYRKLWICLTGCLLLLAIYQVCQECMAGNPYSYEQKGISANIEQGKSVGQQDALKNIWKESSYAKLGQKIPINDLDMSAYKRVLVSDTEEYVKSIYTYESDGFYLSQKQAMKLCAELLIAEKPQMESELEWVMAYSEEGYVGYRMNYRVNVMDEGQFIVKQIAENRIGTLGYTNYAQDVFEIYEYEAFSDVYANGELERRFPITATFYFFLEDKVIIQGSWHS